MLRPRPRPEPLADCAGHIRDADAAVQEALEIRGVPEEVAAAAVEYVAQAEVKALATEPTRPGLDCICRLIGGRTTLRHAEESLLDVGGTKPPGAKSQSQSGA